VLSLLHALVTVSFQADQVVSGLAVNFVGVGLSMVLGEGLSKAGAVSLLPVWSVPVLSQIPIIGPIMFSGHSPMVYVGYLLTPAVAYYIMRTRPGMHLRAVGESPAAADALGINVYRLRYLYVLIGGLLAGLAGGTISLAVSPGWFSELTTGGQGWIAVGLVIFAQWDPWRAAGGAYMFGALRRLILDLQGPQLLLGFANPFYYMPKLGFSCNAALCTRNPDFGDRVARGAEKARGRPCALAILRSRNGVVDRTTLAPEAIFCYSWVKYVDHPLGRAIPGTDRNQSRCRPWRRGPPGQRKNLGHAGVSYEIAETTGPGHATRSPRLIPRGRTMSSWRWVEMGPPTRSSTAWSWQRRTGVSGPLVSLWALLASSP
jgi:simple sugar transport system permease protein